MFLVARVSCESTPAVREPLASHFRTGSVWDFFPLCWLAVFTKICVTRMNHSLLTAQWTHTHTHTHTDKFPPFFFMPEKSLALLFWQWGESIEWNEIVGQRARWQEGRGTKGGVCTRRVCVCGGFCVATPTARVCVCVRVCVCGLPSTLSTLQVYNTTLWIRHRQDSLFIVRLVGKISFPVNHRSTWQLLSCCHRIRSVQYISLCKPGSSNNK